MTQQFTPGETPYGNLQRSTINKFKNMHRDIVIIAKTLNITQMSTCRTDK